MSPKIPKGQPGRVKQLIEEFEEIGRAKAKGEPSGDKKKAAVPEIKEGHVSAVKAKLRLEAKGLFTRDTIAPGIPKKAPAGEPSRGRADPVKSETKEDPVSATGVKLELEGEDQLIGDGAAPGPSGSSASRDNGGATAGTAGLKPPEAPAAPEVPALVPPPVDIPKGSKFGKKKVRKVDFGGGETGDVKVSHIKSENGAEYIISNAQALGGYGKFRYAVDLDGKRWAVKEFRSHETRSKGTKTYKTDMDAIKAEIETMEKAGSSITVKDVMNIEGKVYAVMPIMSGEVKDILLEVEPQDRQCVARSVLRQMAEDIGECHSKGYVHRDVKLRNALWNPEGRVALCDFGLATPAPPVGSRLRGQAGSPGYMGPEMFFGEGHDAKTDTWSLALSVAEFHAGWQECPFLVAPWGDWGRLKDGQEVRLFTEYDQWRKGLITPAGLDTGRIVKEGGNQWDVYFSKLLAADPVLCEYMLSHMLVNNPAERASMEEVKVFMEGVQSAESSGETQSKMAFGKLEGDTQKKDAIFKLLEKDRLVFSPNRTRVARAYTQVARWFGRLP
jgi:serine/threonine protein kinase